MIWKKMMTIATQLTKNAAVRRYGTPAKKQGRVRP
jgi:hypothetical protein